MCRNMVWKAYQKNLLWKPSVSQFGLIQLLLPTELVCVVVCSMTQLLTKEKERNFAVCNSHMELLLSLLVACGLEGMEVFPRVL